LHRCDPRRGQHERRRLYHMRESARHPFLGIDEWVALARLAVDAQRQAHGMP
jgi:hypothetical protein